jgi:uncharacterized protein with PIN domain
MYGYGLRRYAFKECPCCKYGISKKEWDELPIQTAMVEDATVQELKLCPKCRQSMWNKVCAVDLDSEDDAG